MSGPVILDATRLASDLKVAAEYASKAGLLTDGTILAKLKEAQATLLDPQGPDIFVLTSALNDLLHLIAPISISDLHGGRDPFGTNNQRKSKLLSLSLAFFSVLILITIGWFMQALRIEQGALVSLNKIQQQHPQLKLIALRKMAQYDEPMKRPSALYDDYHQRLSELKDLAGDIYTTYQDALDAYYKPLFPINFATVGSFLKRAITKDQQSGPVASSGQVPQPGDSVVPDDSFCVDESSNPGMSKIAIQGEIKRITDAAKPYPEWLKSLLADTNSDFCFKLKVFAGQGDVFNQAAAISSFASRINGKIALRTSWFLPFLYGLLGSVIFLLRNSTNVRAPSMELFPIILRLSLGGVAGIVVGWFSSASNASAEATSNLSLPFAMAFLTGYAIDSLFVLLDKLNKAANDVSR
jgi:hypothetical protein